MSEKLIKVLGILLLICLEVALIGGMDVAVSLGWMPPITAISSATGGGVAIGMLWYHLLTK